MWDEVVTCYQLLQKPHRAEVLVRERLAAGEETPYMVCALADLTADEELYEKAWVLRWVDFIKSDTHDSACSVTLYQLSIMQRPPIPPR